MTFWLVAALIALGWLLRLAFERPNPHADVDELIAQRRDRTHIRTRDC